MQSDCYCLFMCLQLLVGCHYLNRFPYCTNPIGGKLLESDLFDEAIQIYPAISMCIAVGRKRMVRAGGIIACALRRIRTEKDTSGILYFIYPVGIIGCLDNQMLRRIAVGEINRLLTVFQHHDTAVAKGTFCDFLARKPFQFLADGLQHRLDNRFRIGYQHRLTVCPMFRLRKEIREGATMPAYQLPRRAS